MLQFVARRVLYLLGLSDAQMEMTAPVMFLRAAEIQPYYQGVVKPKRKAKRDLTAKKSWKLWMLSLCPY